MLRVDVHSEVYVELEQSRAWYENQAKGLGIEFLDEVDRAINLIRQFPNTWSLYCGGTRRLLLHGFLSESYIDTIRIKFGYLPLCIYAEDPGIGRTESFRIKQRYEEIKRREIVPLSHKELMGE